MQTFRIKFVISESQLHQTQIIEFLTYCGPMLLSRLLQHNNLTQSGEITLKSFLSLVILCLLTATVSAQNFRTQFNRETTTVKKARSSSSRTQYKKIELSDLVRQQETQNGQLVSVMAEVLSYDAKLQKLELFDARSKKVVNVSLSQVNASQRQSLAKQPATDVTVYGKVSSRSGQPVIVAHKLELILLEAERK